MFRFVRYIGVIKMLNGVSSAFPGTKDEATDANNSYLVSRHYIEVFKLGFHIIASYGLV